MIMKLIYNLSKTNIGIVQKFVNKAYKNSTL